MNDAGLPSGGAVEERGRVGAALEGDRVVDHGGLDALAVLDLADERVAEEPDGGVRRERNRIRAVRADPAGAVLKEGIPLRGGLARGRGARAQMKAPRSSVRPEGASACDASAAPHASFHPLRYSPRIKCAASGQFFAFSFTGSHSIFLPVR